MLKASPDAEMDAVDPPPSPPPPLGDCVQYGTGHVGAVAVPRLDKDVEDAATHAVGIDGDLIGEVDHDHARLFIGHHFERRAPDFGFATAAADSPVSGAIRLDQHARADLAG